MNLRIWPGRPYPLGATWDGSGTNFALYSEHATAVELCLFDSADSELESASHSTRRTYRHGVARLSCPMSCRGKFTAIRVHGPYEPAAGPSLQSAQGAAWIPMPRRSLAKRAGPMRCGAITSAIPPADLSFDERDNARFAPLGRGDRRGVYLGRRSTAKHPLEQDDHLRNARQGIHQAASRRARQTARHVRGAGLATRRSTISRAWASRPSSCCRCTSTSTIAIWSSAGW